MASQRYEIPCSHSDCHQPDLGPGTTEPRETIWRLADRPWPRLGREAVEPALLVAWLSTELTDPMETIDTDLLWLWPWS